MKKSGSYHRSIVQERAAILKRARDVELELRRKITPRHNGASATYIIRNQHILPQPSLLSTTTTSESNSLPDSGVFILFLHIL